MHRPLLSLAVASLSAAALHAQCLTVSGAPVTLVPTTTIYPADDEGLSAPLPLGFAFPVGANTYTHVAIESNGVIYLTNGTPPVGTTTYGYQDMAGAAGASPRVAVYWTDLEGITPGWGVRMDTSVAGEARICWVNVNEYFQPGSFTVVAILRSSGLLEVTLPAGLSPLNYQVTVGVSAGNGLVGVSGDLSAGATSTIASLYEDFFYPTLIDVANTTTTIIPNTGGFIATTTCVGPPPARNTAYGAGCYTLTSSFYELFPGFPSTFDLNTAGMSMILTPAGYTILPAVATYAPPPATATSLALFDDSDTPVALSSPFPYPGGTTSTLTVCSNGFVSAGSNNGASYYPDLFEFLNSPDACWRGAWHDFNPASTGSGQVKHHVSGSVVYFTWDGVHNYGTTTPETFQMQFDTSNGSVHVLWVALTGAGNDFLVGFTRGIAAVEPPMSDLSVAIPATFSIYGADVLSLALSASPAPVSTPTTGTVVTYTTDNMLALAPGVYVGLLIISGGQTPAPGIDLGLIGAPGCFAHVASLDITLAMVGATSTQTVPISVPPGLPVGTTIFLQSAALFPPNSLPNGQNAFGIQTSNGLETFISTQ
jgi:hypothetical protein